MDIEETRFLCIGLIMQDILIKGVAKLPSHWEDTVSGDIMFSDTGGGAANSARTFGKLGCEVSIAGRIGEDSFGRLITETFINDGVSVEHLKHDDKNPTGASVGLVNDMGERCFTTVRGCNLALSIDDFGAVDFSQYQYVHINGYFQFPSLESEMDSLLTRIKASGCILSFDTASWDPSGRWYETIHPFIRHIDYFFANDSQLKQLSGHEDIAASSDFLLKDGAKNVIAKLGAKGSVHFYLGQPPVKTGAFEVTVTDTTGAGDSFDAAYMLGISKGWSLKKCGLFANTVAGLNCGSLGAVSGVTDFSIAQNEMTAFYGYSEE